MEYVILRNGVKMPILGYGVYQVTKEECERWVPDALRKLKVHYFDLCLLYRYFQLLFWPNGGPYFFCTN